MYHCLLTDIQYYKLCVDCHLQSLLLLSYLLRNGSDRVVSSARDHLYDLRQLADYTCVDELGKDQGINGNCCLLLMLFIKEVKCLAMNFVFQHIAQELC
jgi:hypothetical protein